MKRIMEIANAVAKALEEYGATVDLAPEYTLKEANFISLRNYHASKNSYPP